MNKVIVINGSNYKAVLASDSDAYASVCGKCAFYSGRCPEDNNGKALCWEYGDLAYFAAEPTKALVEEFKEAAGITTERTFTEAEVLAAYKDWFGADSEAERFVAHLKKFSDPEYKEFLRMKKKFGE